MPRRDAPGVVHHVTLRGVAQCEIFRDDLDRASLLDRIACVAQECGATLLAFAFTSNHVHGIVRTGPIPLARAMARINTAYAMHFNRRHERVGHLFQNRYGAVLIEDDAHLRNAIRYVHANPLAAGIVRDLAALEAYAWSGHGILLGARAPEVLDVASALAVFGDSPHAARSALRAFMLDWAEVKGPELERTPAPLLLPELELEIARIAGAFGVEPRDVRGGSRRREACRARAALAHLAFRVHGLPAAEVALRLGVTASAVVRAAARGEDHVTAAARSDPESHR
jgi:REP element-mobilizing transposase RayT